jgi:tetratricopeptide (TPR) repeat protein
MTRSLGSQVTITHEHGASLRAAKVATVALSFLLLAYAGIQGQRHARRQAQLDDMMYCRDNLQEALDARRSAATGPTPKRSTTDAHSWSRPVTEWAARLERRITGFRSTHTSASEAEDLELRLSEATLAVAQRRFSDALRAITAAGERLPPRESGTRDRRTEILRGRADVCYDTGDWTAALEHYRQILLRQPELLSVVERVAECLYSLQQRDGALHTYIDLARRLHDRGTRLLMQLDHRGAARDLNQAATIRLWLAEQGRRELAADVARSFSWCATALVELRNLELADVYFAHAIDIQSQLISKSYRNDIAGELADNNAGRARTLLELRQPTEALAHFGSAIDIVSRLVNEGQIELRRKLATTFAHRGIVRQARGQLDAAAQDFEQAAGAFAATEGFAEAVAWQTRALEVAGDDRRSEAQLRLEHYRSREPRRDSSNPAP